MLGPLTLTPSHLQQMIAHAQAGLPNEACGLLAGQGGRVLRVYPVPNANPSPFHYSLEPHAQVRVMNEIDENGWELAGIFHSHPGGPPVPSLTDVREAYYPESVYVILSPDGAGHWRARGFEIAEGQAREVELRVEGE